MYRMQCVVVETASSSTMNSPSKYLELQFCVFTNNFLWIVCALQCGTGCVRTIICIHFASLVNVP